MKFIREYMLTRPKGRMKWEDCFKEGCDKGFFKNYTNATSVKDMYHKNKNKNKNKK